MRALIVLIAALAANVGGAAAQGCGPTRLKVVESAEVAAPPGTVWTMLGDFQDLRWDGDVVGVRGTGGNVPEAATRTVTLRNGTALVESLYRYDRDAMSYAYHLDRVDLATLPIQNASATLEVLPAGGGLASTVRWKIAFYRNLVAGEGAADAADERAIAAVRRFLQAGLAGLHGKAFPPS